MVPPLLGIPPVELPPTGLPANEPPAGEPAPGMLMPPLDTGLPPVVVVPAPPVPMTCPAPPLELPLVLLAPAAVLGGSVGVPELQAAMQRSQAGVCFQE